MAAGQAVAQPLAEEQVELGLFIRLVHRGVGVGINAVKAPRTLRADHLGHARIMIDPHLQTRHRQPGQAVLLTHLDGRGIGAGFQHLQSQHTE